MPAGTGTRFVDKYAFVLGKVPANYTGAATTSQVVSLRDYNHATVVITTGAWAGGTAAVTLTQATDIAAGTTKALAFDKQFTNVLDSSTPVLTETTVASNTFNLSAANATHVIEVDAETLDVSNGYDCLRVDVASPGSNNDLYQVEIILSGARYSARSANMPSPILD